MSTGNGTLQTAIPFFSLEGPGRTSMSFGIYHRSNPVSGASYPNTRGYAGRGWQPSTFNFVYAGGSAGGATVYDPTPRQVMAGNSVNHWVTAFDGNGAPTGYVRRPGVRADLERIMSGGTLIGWKVVDQATKVRYLYQNHDGFQTPIWHLTQVIDPRGNTVTYTYDSLERVTQITDAAGRYATFNWPAGSTGQLQSVSLYAGSEVRTWNLVYFTAVGYTDMLNKVEMPPAATGASRPTVRFEYYNSNDSIAEIYDPRGARWSYTYGNLSGYGEVAGAVYEPLAGSPGTVDTSNPTVFNYYTNNSNSATSATLNGTTFTLQRHTFTTAIVDRLGEIWRHEYDYGVSPPTTPGATIIPNEWMGNPIRRVYDPTSPHPNGGGWNWFESYNWDYTQGTLSQYADREGRVTDLLYAADQRGLCHTKKQYLGSTTVQWSYGYTNDRLTTQTSPDGIVTSFGWNYTNDEMTSKTLDPSGQNLKTNFTYNSQGELASTWTGSDNPIVNGTFDAAGNARTVTDPAGNTSYLTFDAWGNKLTEQPPAPSGLTSFEYDNYDRLTNTTLPGGATVGTTYDLNGNATVARKEDGTLIPTTYDAFNRPTSVTQPTGTANLVTAFGYNLRGERISVTNPRGKTTYYDFDDRGKLWRIRYPDATNRQFAYDGVGNRRWVQNGRGQKTWFGYDALNRLTAIDYPSSTDVAYTYSLEGRRLTMVDGTGTSTYTYDTAGRAKTTTQGLTGKTVSQTYLPGVDRRATLAVGSQTWTLDYHPSLLLKRVQQTIGSPVPMQLEYEPNSALSYREAGNLKRTHYGYDTRGRIVGISHRTFPNPTQTTEQEIQYVYGSDGNIQSYNDIVVGNWTWNTTYTHDLADRLTSEVRSGVGISAGTYSAAYTYDGNGNRTSVARNNAPPLSYGAAGNNDQFTTGEGYTFSGYDNDGDPTSVTGPSLSMGLTYDEMGRVTAISGTGASTFRYDGDGRRVERIAGGVTTRYVYDGDQVCLETNGSNVATLYRLAGVGTVKATSGVQTYEQENALGSALTVRDNSGAVVGRTEYDAYGREVYASGTDRGNYRFAGKHGYTNDDATGMQLLGARYYLPVLGRFLTQDPIGHEGGLNLYAYCDNSPLQNVDPDGRQKLDLDSINAQISQAMLRAVRAPREAMQTLTDLSKLTGLGEGTRRLINSKIWDVRLQINLMQSHHYLPRQFTDFFGKRNINIENYTRLINAELHRLVHGKWVEGMNYGPWKRELFEDWNGRWGTWIRANPTANRTEVLQHMNQLAKEFRLPSPNGS